MEYIGNCPECKHHTIVTTVKQIKKTTARNPQRKLKCARCGATARITIIGTIGKPINATNEFDPECGTTDTLRIQLW
jgi:transcription elongation factor Elf1